MELDESPEHSEGGPPKKPSQKGSAPALISDKNGSPITGIIEEAQVLLDFGKYEGKSVKHIADHDPELYAKLAGERESGVFAIRRHKDKTFRLTLNPLSNIDH